MSKQSPHRIIQNQFDMILFEEGCFSPLNWLLREGHLDYGDYQKWRKGKSAFLEDHFKTTSTEIIADLLRTQDYATALKLKSFSHAYTSTTSQPLHFCRSPANELIFTTVYEPAKDRMQLDLFFDSAPACTAYDLIRAIIDKRIDDITVLLTKLKTSSPEKHQQFARLLAFEKTIMHSKETSDRKITLLNQVVTPLAFDILGRFAHDFITPLWHKLSVDIADRHFEAEAPEYHLSFTAFKGYQWQQVLSSIDRERNWIKQPLLLFRYAEACFKLNKEQEGIANWFNLFILFPETAERLIDDTCHRLMFSDWQYFSELDPELEPSLFPAWMVMNKPALAKNTVISDRKGNESLQLIANLVCTANSEINETVIHLRARLQHNSPALFVHYMRAKDKQDHGSSRNPYS